MCVLIAVVLLLNGVNVCGTSELRINNRHSELLNSDATPNLRGLYSNFVEAGEKVDMLDDGEEDDGEEEDGGNDGGEEEDGQGEEGDEAQQQGAEEDGEDDANSGEESSEGENEKALENAEDAIENAVENKKSAEEDVNEEVAEEAVAKKAKAAEKEMEAMQKQNEADKKAKVQAKLDAKKAHVAAKSMKPKVKRSPWAAYIDSLEPTGVASKCTTTCRKDKKRKAQVCETLCEPIFPVGEKGKISL